MKRDMDVIRQIVLTVGLGNMLVQSAPPGHAKPMRTWLSLASEGEIAQDAAQLPPEQLAELLCLQAASKPARLDADAKDTKPSGGD